MKQVTVTAPATPITPCPHCQQPLFDPDGLGWCKACGYCRSVAEGATKVKVAKAPALAEKLAAISPTRSIIRQTPIWLIVMVVGVLAIVGSAFAIDRYVPLTPLRRAVLTSSVMGGGIFLMFVGQFIALLKIAPDDPTLGFKDAVFPFRLYGLILKRLPELSFTVYLGAWGLTAALTVALVIGGLGHWFTYLPDSQKNQKQKTNKKSPYALFSGGAADSNGPSASIA